MPLPSSQLLVENRAGQLWATPAGFLWIVWGIQPRVLAETQALLQHVRHALHQRHWCRVLINQSHMQPFTSEEQHWIATAWLPEAVRAGGYRYGAVVVSPAVLVRLATAFVTTSVQGLPLTYRSFDTDEEAVRWLQQQPATPSFG